LVPIYHNVAWAEAYLLPSGILIHPAIWPQQVGPRIRGAVPLWGRGSWVPIYYNVARAEAYLHVKFHLDPFNRLAKIYQRYRQDRWTDNDLVA